MPEIRYEEWAYIPIDDEPATGEPTSFNPPMISTMALDLHASLIFRFATAHPPLTITVESTALSAEYGNESLFSLYSGTQTDRYGAIAHPGWELHYDGMYAVFTTKIQGCEPFLKLHYTQQQNLIIGKVAFSQP